MGLVPWTYSSAWFHDEPIAHIQLDPKAPINHGPMGYHRNIYRNITRKFSELESFHGSSTGCRLPWAPCLQLLRHWMNVMNSNYSSQCRAWGFWSSCYEANEEDSDAEVGNRTLLSSQMVLFWLRRISWCSMLLYWLNQLGVGRKPSFLRYTPANNILELKQSALNSKLNLVQPSKVSGHKHENNIW